MYFSWAPYVSVATRLTKARKFAAKKAKQEGRVPAPVQSKSRKIATKFWGQAWCENLNHYSDFENRLPRGRTYLGNGSVVDLQILRGQVKAIVAGSETYHVGIKIKTLPAKIWETLRSDCAQSINSLIDLLQGRFDESVMQRIARRDGGLFPQPKEIEMSCSCPDGARVCKHIAAVVYGVGVRLDTAPELLFLLRNVDHNELITQAGQAGNLGQALATDSNALAGSDLGELFGIDLDTSAGVPTARKPAATRRAKASKAVKPPVESKAIAGVRVAAARQTRKPARKVTKKAK